MKSLFDVEKRKADGGIIKTITKETLTNFMFSIPCLDEQQKIADCLSVGYAVVEQDKIAIDALKKLKTYMLQKMFV